MDAKNTFFSIKTTLNCRGKIVDISEPKVMGIVNVTPDSFYSGSKFSGLKEVLAAVERMLTEGADFIDIGGMSSRPGAEVISEDEELQRVVRVVDILHRHFPETILSIDTVRARVAAEGIAAGASIVNDISAGKIDTELLQMVAKLKVPYILMHMKGMPKNMQEHPEYDDVTLEVVDFLAEKIVELKEAGVNDIIIDPGFGFGKNLQHNYELLNNLDQLKIFDLPILVGISRKSMICQALKVNPDKALNGTTAAHIIALQRGANILRVHDVREAKEALRIYQLSY